MKRLISGWLYDETGSYDISFYVAGTTVALSGAMLYFIPLLQKCLGRESPRDEFDVPEPEQEMQNLA